MTEFVPGGAETPEQLAVTGAEIPAQVMSKNAVPGTEKFPQRTGQIPDRHRLKDELAELLARILAADVRAFPDRTAIPREDDDSESEETPSTPPASSLNRSAEQDKMSGRGGNGRARTACRIKQPLTCTDV